MALLDGLAATLAALIVGLLLALVPRSVVAADAIVLLADSADEGQFISSPSLNTAKATTIRLFGVAIRGQTSPVLGVSCFFLAEATNGDRLEGDPTRWNNVLAAEFLLDANFGLQPVRTGGSQTTACDASAIPVLGPFFSCRVACITGCPGSFQLKTVLSKKAR